MGKDTMWYVQGYKVKRKQMRCGSSELILASWAVMLYTLVILFKCSVQYPEFSRWST